MLLPAVTDTPVPAPASSRSCATGRRCCWDSSPGWCTCRWAPSPPCGASAISTPCCTSSRRRAVCMSRSSSWASLAAACCWVGCRTGVGDVDSFSSPERWWGVSTSTLLLIPPGHDVLLMINLAVIGLVVSILVIAFPMAMEQNPCFARGTALTFVNLTQMVFAGIGQWVVGMLLDNATSAGSQGHTGELSPGQFKEAFLLLPVCMLAAFLLSLLVRETKAVHGPEVAESAEKATAS